MCCAFERLKLAGVLQPMKKRANAEIIGHDNPFSLVKEGASKLYSFRFNAEISLCSALNCCVFHQSVIFT